MGGTLEARRSERASLSTRTELRLLLVSGDPMEGRLLKANLDRQGRLRADVAESGVEALKRLRWEPFDAVIADVAHPENGGIALVRRIRELNPSLPVFLLTTPSTLDRAAEAIRAGATELLPKPVSVDALLALLERAVSERPLREELAERLGRARDRPEDRLVGSDPRLDRVRRFATQMARLPGGRILITGESGTGKGLVARLIHELADSTGRFVEVNCAALPPNLLESELFGHEKGAFTDAKELKRGLIELAHDGTLLLDEIGSLPLDLQAKLLGFLESQEIRRVGGTQPIPIRTRVIAATNEDLAELVRRREFRSDLFYRLDVAAVEMPALRDMPGVIPELAAHFVRELAGELERPMPELTEPSFGDLDRYPWPGNARELRNAVERALIFHEQGPLVVRPPVAGRGSPALPAGVVLEPGLSLEEVEARYLAATLEEADGRPLEEIARKLGISRKTLWERRKRHGL